MPIELVTVKFSLNRRRSLFKLLFHYNRERVFFSILGCFHLRYQGGMHECAFRFRAKNKVYWLGRQMHRLCFKQSKFFKIQRQQVYPSLRSKTYAGDPTSRNLGIHSPHKAKTSRKTEAWTERRTDGRTDCCGNQFFWSRVKPLFPPARATKAACLAWLAFHHSLHHHEQAFTTRGEEIIAGYVECVSKLTTICNR